MKKSRLLSLFTIANFVATLCFIIFVLPDVVVFRFTSDLVASEFIGKWYNIILPSLATIACFIILIIDVREDGAKKHVFRYLIAYVAVAVCSYFTWAMMGIQVHLTHVTNNAITIPWTIIILFPIAYFMLANGAALGDKSDSEFSLFGFKWVKSNYIVWQKTHKFAGRMSILVGLCLLVMAVLNETIYHTDWMYGIAMLAWFVLYYLFVLIYSKCIEGKYNR
ncbi:MAG: SdpI family protein [Clostridiales bacterium]|nr:SdpI family protein [Clostridiales bacterium]